MTVTYTWSVTGIKTTSEGDLQDAVVQTYWVKTGTDEEGNTGTFTGATPFPMSSINQDNFVKYDDLTEEIVLGWIKAAVVDTYEEHVNAAILKQIKNKKNPVVDKSMPWVPAPAPGPAANTN